MTILDFGECLIFRQTPKSTFVKVLEWPASNFPGDLRSCRWGRLVERLLAVEEGQERQSEARNYWQKLGMSLGVKAIVSRMSSEGFSFVFGGLEVDPCSPDLAFVFTTMAFNSFYQYQ